MIELVLIACLRLDPQVCQEKVLPFVEVSTITCSIAAQPVLAEWSGRNPTYRISRWFCREQRRERWT
jgi:hypothetical protein